MDKREKAAKRQAWGAVLAVFAAGIALAWQQNKIVPLVSVLLRVFQTDGSTVGWLSSVFSVMGIVMAVPSSMILKKLGVRACGLLSLGCAVIGSVLGVFTDSVALLLVSRMIEGAGVGIISVLAPYVIALWFAPERRGLPMGVWGSWQMVAQSAIFFSASAINAWMGWRGMWYAGILLCLLAGLIYMLLISEPEAGAPSGGRGTGLRQLCSARMWILGAASFLYCFCYFGWLTWIVPVWSGAWGLSESGLNDALAYMYILQILLVLLVGKLYDRFIGGRKLIAVAASLAYAALMAAGFLMENSGALVPYLAAFALFDGTVVTYLWVAAPQMAKSAADGGAALAVLTLCMNVGTVAGPPLIGGVLDAAGRPAAGAIMAGCMCLAALILFLNDPYCAGPGEAAC